MIKLLWIVWWPTTMKHVWLRPKRTKCFKAFDWMFVMLFDVQILSNMIKHYQTQSNKVYSNGKIFRHHTLFEHVCLMSKISYTWHVFGQAKSLQLLLFWIFFTLAFSLFQTFLLFCDQSLPTSKLTPQSNVCIGQ